ncbi:MAG: hypothetical protein CK550_00815 [Gemmatimonadetes bacterium]|nr:MAG: hypothetical protein CK550_00815 [Gemmatimonadota bacterium]
MTTRCPLQRCLRPALIVLLGVGQLAGCRGHTASSSSHATTLGHAIAADTVRGIMAITGSEPLTTMQLTTTTGSRWQLVGDSLQTLRAAVGLEIMVRGVALATDPTARPDAQFAVVRFVVRRADGVAAQDGVIEPDGTGFALRMADDRRASLIDAPLALRERIGARIWWAGPLDRAPIAYGILTTAR